MSSKKLAQFSGEREERVNATIKKSARFMLNMNNIHEKLNYFMFASCEKYHLREFCSARQPKKKLICVKRTSYKLAVWFYSDNDSAINNRL